ncbi:unnamed protein product [Urochloa humidicola]
MSKLGAGGKKALIGGTVEAEQQDSGHGGTGAYVWFEAAATAQRVGVCRSMWERMRWEQRRGGWVDEEVAGCRSVLVERFVVKRLDGSVVVAFDFVHPNKLRAKQL